MSARIWIGLLALWTGLQGCSSPGVVSQLQRMGPSLPVVPLGASPQPASAALAEPAAAAATPVAVRTPSPKALPEKIGLTVGLLPYADPEITGNPYEAAQFTCDYPPTWAAYPPSPEDIQKGQVMYLESEYNLAWMEVLAYRFEGQLEEFYGAVSLVAEDQVEDTTVVLDGVKGIQIQANAYYNGKKLDKYVMSFALGDRLVSMRVEYDPGSKDAEILKKELAYILGTWKWRR